MPSGEPDRPKLPKEGSLGPDTPKACRRTGLLYLVVGVPVLVIVGVLSALAHNWIWLVSASPIFVLCFALALILCLRRPDEPDEPDELDGPDDGAGQAAQPATHLRRSHDEYAR
jgi:hypothetical protein